MENKTMTKSTITRELVHWLHDAATEFASTKLKMTMKPDEVLALTGALLASMDTEPVGWTDEAELRDVEKDGCGYLFKANPISPHADPRRVIKLYRHAQPAQVVPEEATPDSIEILTSGMKTNEMRPLILGTPAAPQCSKPTPSYPAVTPLPCRVAGFR
jgi:hypothetical protein